MVQCPECQSSNVRKEGLRHTKKEGIKQEWSCKDCQRWFRTEAQGDEDLLISNVQLAKQNQRLRDTNRVKDKSFREDARIENAITEYNREIVELLKTVKIDAPKIKKNTIEGKGAGVIQLADLHFNELIAELFNSYDFTEASRRLQLYAMKSKIFFKSLGFKQVIVANTGDTLNSDRRLDEFMNQASNRAKASVLSVYLLEQFLLDLLKDFEVTYIQVTGNESRAKDELGWTDIVATDNYDFSIYEMLKLVFRNVKGMDFSDGDWSERKVNIAGHNVLFVHGNQLPNATGVEKAIQQLIGKYALRGEVINYVITGHFHSARIGDIYARSSSMCGGNTYSDKELQLASRPSQNIYMFWTNGQREAVKIDLFHTQGLEGYDLIKQLEAYHVKSADKIRHKETILTIKI